MTLIIVLTAAALATLTAGYALLKAKADRYGPRIRYVKWVHWFGKSGIALPPLGIYIDQVRYLERSEEARVRLLRHEKVHWDQWEQLGFWRGNVGYVLLWFRFGYRNHPREVEARKVAAS